MTARFQYRFRHDTDAIQLLAAPATIDAGDLAAYRPTGITVGPHPHCVQHGALRGSVDAAIAHYETEHVR